MLLLTSKKSLKLTFPNFFLMHEQYILKMLGILTFSKYIFIWAAGNLRYIKLLKFKKLKALHGMFCVFFYPLCMHMSQFLVLWDGFLLNK